MPLLQQTWDVVAFGRWNPGILTPRGIVDRLFEDRQSDAEWEVEYPEDAVGPCRVNYNGLAISVTDAYLAVQAKEVTFENLSRAMAVVKRAMENLLETPVSGVAINLRYAGPLGEDLAPLADSLRHPWEQKFAEGQYKVFNRSVSFSVKWDGGIILITLGSKPDVGYRVTISFRQSGLREDILHWLSLEPRVLRHQQTAIFLNVFGIRTEAAQ